MIKLLVGCYSPCIDPKANTACFFQKWVSSLTRKWNCSNKTKREGENLLLAGWGLKTTVTVLAALILKGSLIFFCLVGFGFVFPSVWGKYSYLKTFCYERVLEETHHKRSFVVKICFIFVWCWVISRGFFLPFPITWNILKLVFSLNFWFFWSQSFWVFHRLPVWLPQPQFVTS